MKKPFPPPINFENYDAWEKRIPGAVFVAEAAIDVLNPNTVSKQMLIGTVYEGYDPVRLDYDYQSFRAGKKKITQKGGKHLCMIVDLTKTKSELFREFKGWIDGYKGYQKMLTEKSRKKPNTVTDIWEVWDMYSEGLQIKEITTKLISKFERPEVVNSYQATYNAVKRAIEKATRIIKEVEQSYL